MELDAVDRIVFVLEGGHAFPIPRILVGDGDVVLVFEVFEFVEIRHLKTEVVVEEGEWLLSQLLNVEFGDFLHHLRFPVEEHSVVQVQSSHIGDPDVELGFGDQNRLEAETNGIDHEDSSLLVDFLGLLKNLQHSLQVLRVVFVFDSKVASVLVTKGVHLKEGLSSREQNSIEVVHLLENLGNVLMEVD